MDKDDAFLNELQVNDKVKVIVNIFGQELTFEGPCTGKTDDKISIMTDAKTDPVEFPLSAILKGTITSKNTINIEESTEINTYNQIEIKYPEVIYGYYIVDLNIKKQSNDFENSYNELSKSTILTAILLSLRDFFSDSIIKHLYNENAYNLNNIKTFGDFCKNKNREMEGLYHEYLDSLDIYINKPNDNQWLVYFLQKYLGHITCLDELYFYLQQDLKEEIQLTTCFYFCFISIIEIIFIYHIYAFVNKWQEQLNIRQRIEKYNEHLFTYQIILKSLFKTTIDKILYKYNYKPETAFTIKFFSSLHMFIETMSILEKNNDSLSKMIDSWLTEQVKKNNLFNPESLNKNTNDDITFDKPILIPITSIDGVSQSAKYTLIKIMYSLYINESKLLHFTVSNKELHEHLTNYIRSKFNLDNDLDSSVKNIYNQFTKIINRFFSNIVDICNYFVSISFYEKDNKEIYNIINTKTNSIIYSLEHEADRYIIVTSKFNNRLKIFFKRLALISSPVNKLDFSKAEEQLLFSYQNCSELIMESSEEIFSGTIEFYLDLINTLSHFKKITIDFYSKFITEINISVIKHAISFNTEVNRIFIPLKISSSKHGQTSYIIKICTRSSLIDKTNNDLHTNVKLLPDGHIFYLAEISYTDFDQVLNGFDIDINLEYKFKTSWDFDKCEATWETREISESFCIHDEIKHLTEFHEIRNLFRDYSSGSVIKDDRMFFGRDQDIKHVIENIRDESGRIVTNRCVCIYGQTRTGKSSLLYHIKKGLRESPSNIIVDIGDIGSTGATEAGIKYRILSSLLEEIEIEHDDICALLSDSGISMTADPERNKTDESYFTEQIGKIRSILRRKAKDTQIIILIDEFTYIYDWIKEKKLSENFMKFWKAFITNYDICAIIVGQDHMMKFINDQRFTNAFGAIRTWEVNYLKEPDACKLVTMPVSDSPDYAGENGCTILPEAVNLLVEMTSGSAYLLMNICADFIDYLNERHALTATRGHAEDFLRRNLSKFEERWFEPLFNDKSDLDSDASITANKELLKKLALSYSEHSGVLPDELSLTDNEKERLQSLEARRVVEMKDGRWRITVRIYAEWLRNKFGSK